MSDTVDHTGKVPLTVWVDPPPEGKERHAIFQGFMADGAESWMLVLRPIMPATVMVEMTREDAEYHASWTGGSNIAILRLAVSARAALARKPYPQFDPAKHVDPTLGPDEVRLDGKVYKLKLPCPVMVCGLRQTACYSDEPERCLDRRPCKHSEGHGGEHE